MKKSRKRNHADYVIVGNSVAGIAAFEAIRARDRGGSVVIVDRERRHVYSRALLPYYLVGRASDELMRLRPLGFYEAMGASTRFGCEVERIDVRRKQLVFSDGSRLGYVRLLLAVGAAPDHPEIGGLDGPHVFTFTCMNDVVAIRKAVGKERAVLVIGAGLIGVKVAEGLTELGVKVTLVEAADRPLPAVLDDVAGAIVAAHLRRSGVRLLLSRRVVEIRRKGKRITGAVLDGGEEIPCADVVLAVGVKPRIELCRGTGIRAKRGIIVDRHMATSVEGIYAAGDVTEATVLRGGRENIPIWPLAFAQGRVAGDAMAGGMREYLPGMQMNAIELFGLPLITLGESASDGGGEVYRTRWRKGLTYRRVVVRGNCVAGAIFMGEIERAGIIAGLMQDKVDVSSFKEELLSDRFGYICVPRQYRAKHVAPMEV